jgi:hypothetical protein
MLLKTSVFVDRECSGRRQRAEFRELLDAPKGHRRIGVHDFSFRTAMAMAVLRYRSIPGNSNDGYSREIRRGATSRNSQPSKKVCHFPITDCPPTRVDPLRFGFERCPLSHRLLDPFWLNGHGI